MTRPLLSASSLWRAERCPASAILPHAKQVYADATRGSAAHAELEANPPAGSIPEVAFAYDVVTRKAREIGRSIGREYGPLADSEIPGTTDLLTLGVESLRITDYKSGNGYAEQLAGVAEHPERNLQLLHNVLCAAIVYEKNEAHIEVVYLKTGEIKEAVLDVFDFAEIRERLHTIWQATQVAPIAVRNDSVQCWRCPAKAACPQWSHK